VRRIRSPLRGAAVRDRRDLARGPQAVASGQLALIIMQLEPVNPDELR